MILNKLLTINGTKINKNIKTIICLNNLSERSRGTSTTSRCISTKPIICNNNNNKSNQTRRLSLKSMSEKQLLNKQLLWLSVNKCERLYGKQFQAERQYEEVNSSMYSHLSTNESLIGRVVDLYNKEKYLTERVPSSLRDIHVRVLMEIDDFMRVAYINKLYKDELQKWFITKRNFNNMIKARNDKLRKLALLNAPTSGLFNSNQQLIYELNYNCLTLEFTDQYWKRYLRHKLRLAALFGNRIVIDCGFNDIIELYNLEYIVHLINKLINYNCYTTKEAFDLYFCNVHFNSDLFHLLSNHDTLKEFELNFNTQSYIDLFPNQQLIYLSQYSEEVIDQFDNEAVYILPAITHDYGLQAALKAKKQGIQVSRLPLNEYGYFSRSTEVEFLNMREVAGILHDVRSGCHWLTAFNSNLVHNNYISFVDDIADIVKNRFRRLKSKAAIKFQQV